MNPLLKRILVFLIVLALLIGGAFAYYYFFISKQEPAFNANQPVNGNVNVNGGQLPQSNDNNNQNTNRPAPVVVDPITQAKNSLVPLAISFVERFGSYSNQSNFSNIIELKPFMTSKMSRWADDYINKLKQETGSSLVFHGFNTRVLKTDFISFDKDSSATIMLSTQREEQTGSRVNSRTFYQDIKLELVKEGGVWKVAGAYWQ